MRRRTILTVAGALLALLALGACTSEHGSSSSSELAPGRGDAAGPQASAAAGAAAMPASAGAPKAPAIGTAALLTDTRALIRTAYLTVGVRHSADVAAQANRADTIVTGAGGEVFGDDRQSGPSASASLVLKVPPAQLATILNQLAALGTERSRSLSSRDVTTQVADVAARLKSAQDSITRLRTLYAHATKVSDVISIEEELSTREADLESLEGQQRSLSSETDFATVNLNLTTLKAAPVKPHHHSGVGGAFTRGWHGFTAAAAWVFAAFATALPFLVLLAVLAGAAGLWLRRHRPSPLPEPVPEPSL
ncbi:DUF4349 domain-containing protein [Jatrophihabitans sp.]|uniref:DUF4349 domain-containing protein n=1 Tax=Jatrophihabitans sp. TaxID=1932789 RepID=UPI0030C6CC1B|nr:hypothetical protein [Jatrophihabitans sp.]